MAHSLHHGSLAGGPRRTVMACDSGVCGFRGLGCPQESGGQVGLGQVSSGPREDARGKGRLQGRVAEVDKVGARGKGPRTPSASL